MGRKSFATYDDLLHDLDKDSILNEDDELEMLEDEDLALLHGPTPPPAPPAPKKTRKRTPAKKPKKKSRKK